MLKKKGALKEKRGKTQCQIAGLTHAILMGWFRPRSARSREEKGPAKDPPQNTTILGSGPLHAQLEEQCPGCSTAKSLWPYDAHRMAEALPDEAKKYLPGSDNVGGGLVQNTALN